jgi:hypothetical protein
LTNPYQAQQPHDVYGQPPVQHQPAEWPPTAAGMTPSAPPAAPSRKPLIVAAAAALAVLLLAVGGYGLYDRFIREDTGVAACKAMREGKKADGSAKGSGDDKLTEAEYRQARRVFEDSRHDDIREHGTALMDLAWQMSQIPNGQEMGALAFMGPMTTHMSGLQTACANQGVIVTLNTE